MKEEITYINEAIAISYLNKLLILKDANSIVDDLLTRYGNMGILDFLDTYLSNEHNIDFINYFTKERDKLIEVIQILLFIQTRYLNDNEEEYYVIFEENISNLKDYLSIINNINKEKSESKNDLLKYRNLSSNTSDKYLKYCYLFDDEVIKYLNGEASDIKLTDKNQEFYFKSLFYYFNNIIYSVEKDNIKNKINKIIFYKNNIYKEEVLSLITLITKNLKKRYIDIITKEEDKPKIKCHIIDITKYKNEE